MEDDGLLDEAPLLSERLRMLVVVDIAAAALGCLTMFAAYLYLFRSSYLLLVIACVAVSGGVMSLGLRPARTGDAAAAVFWLAIANWSIALSVSAIANFAWPLLSVAALIPAMLAAGYTSGRRLQTYITVSIVVAVAAAALALLQDVSGLSEGVPRWFRHAIVIIWTPVEAFIVAHIVFGNSTRLQGALKKAMQSNADLDASRIALHHQAAELRASRARVVAATDRERRRIERDLHDGAQQRLIAMSMKIAAARRACEADPDRMHEVFDELRTELRAAQVELRNLAQGVYPPVLTEHGLAAALRTVGAGGPVPIRVNVETIDRYDPDVEAVVYFCCVEALQNVAKHAGDEASAEVWIVSSDDSLSFRVIDDGSGIDLSRTPTGSGLDNMADRVGSLGGELQISQRSSGGTLVEGRIPCRARSAV